MAVDPPGAGISRTRPAGKAWTRGRLRPGLASVLQAMQAYAVAEWALETTWRMQPQRLSKGQGDVRGAIPIPPFLLMAVVQALWRKSYRQIVDWVAVDSGLAQALGFPVEAGQPQTPSLSQYWERRQALGILPFLLLFIGLVARLIRLGVVLGQGLIVHDTREGRAIVFLAVWLYRLRVAVVYADAAYFDRRFVYMVRQMLGTFVAVDDNPHAFTKNTCNSAYHAQPRGAQRFT